MISSWAHEARSAKSDMGGFRGRSCANLDTPGVRRRELVPPPFDRGGDAQGFTIFGHRPPGDIDARISQLVHDGIVGQYGRHALAIDHLADAVTYRLGRVRLLARCTGDGGREEILHLEGAAAGADRLVR